MKKSICIVATMSMIIFAKTLCGQKTISYTPSLELIENSVRSYDDKDMKSVVKYLSQVNENDTAFQIANYRLMAAYEEDSNYRAAVDCGIRGLARPSGFQYSYLRNISNYYSELNMHDSSMVYADSLLKVAPFNMNGYFYKGISYINANDNKKGVDMFQHALNENFLFPSPHRNLGYVCYNNRHIVPAVLSLATYCMLEGDGSSVVGALAALEKLFKNEKTWIEDSLRPVYKGENNFDDIEQLVTSQIALQKNYKSYVDIEYYSITKPMQLILEKIEYNDVDKGYWMQVYVPFLIEVRKQKMIEPFILAMFQGLDDDGVKRVLTKNKAMMSKFYDFVFEYWHKKYKKIPVMVNGSERKLEPQYYDNGALRYAGTKVNGEYRGYVVTYYNNNFRSSEGEIDSQGEKTGAWKFYHEDGALKEESNYKNGKVDGTYILYNDAGRPREKGFIANGKLDKKYYGYYADGTLRSEIEVKNDMRNGLFIEYHDNGNIASKREFKNNLLNGVYLYFHYNGKLKDSCFTKNDKLEGKFVSYDLMGRKALDGQFANDERVGNWKWYHRNGKLRMEANYSSGKITGLVKEYHLNGTISEETQYQNDKKDGLSKTFNREGKLRSEITYRKDKGRSYKYFDVNTGAVLAEDKEDKNKIYYKGFFDNGQLSVEGLVQDDNSEGEWKYYYYTGILSAKLNYKDNELDGKQLYYHENGKLKKEITYENGKGQGLVKTYHLNGKLHEQYNLIDDELVGPYEAYFPSGILGKTYYYLDGKINGRSIDYHVDGSPESFDDYFEHYNIATGYYDTLGNISGYQEYKGDTGIITMNYENGKVRWKSRYSKYRINGSSELFHPCGVKRSNAAFVNGKMNGKRTLYFINGNVDEESSLQYGEQFDLEKNYYYEGGITSVVYYENDEAQDSVIWYNTSGGRELEGWLVDGERDGFFNLYSHEGQLQIRLRYDMGTLISYSYLGKDGKFVPEIPLPKGTGSIKGLFQNGKTSFEAEYKNGLLNGKRAYYNADGKVAETMQFEDGWNVGQFKDYYANGMLRIEGTYHENRKHGVFKHYARSGKLLREENYLYGEQHGISKYYNATTGALEHVYNFVYGDAYEMPLNEVAKPAPKPVAPKTPAPKPGGMKK